MVASGEAVIAVGGEWGTLSEIALARKLGGRWSRSRAGPSATTPEPTSGIVEAESPEQAVKAALSAAVVESSSDDRTEAADDVLDRVD